MHQNFSAIVSIPWNKGQKKIGTQEGAQWFAQYLETDLNQKASQFFVDESQDISANLKRMYNEIIKHPPPYIFCGGDHSEAISTVLSIVNSPKYNGKKVACIWLDAHADINTYEMSSSKNYHGMPLSFICGIDKTFDWVNQLKTLPIEHLIYYGIRDIDQYEQNVIKQKNIKVVKVEDDYNEIFKWVKQKQIQVVFLSFDIDGLDPIDIPSTGTLAPNGIRKDTACEFFRKMRKVFEELKIQWSIEIVEYNPLIGGQAGRAKTEESLKELMSSLFK